VGTGEYAIRGNVSHGDGVFKTTDAGRTWTSLGLAETQQISRVRVHPTNPDIVYVAAQGRAFGPNPERGIYKTSDGGKTWTKILFRNDSTGASDLAMDPSNPEVLYAAFWQAQRFPWKLVSGGIGGGIFKTTDGGAHWTELTRNAGLRAGCSATSGSPSRRRNRPECGRSSRPIRAGCTAPTTAARRGRGSTTTTSCACAPGTT